jgi:hypothetical protein
VLKFVAAAVWIIAASVASVHYAYQHGMDQPVEKTEPDVFGGLDYVKSDVISIPILHAGEVQGYFLTRLVFTAEQKKLAMLTVPVQAMLVDELYSALYGDPQVDFTRSRPINLDEFRAGIRDAINARVNDRLIHEVLIEQLEFLTKDDIRERNARGWTEAEIPAAPTPTGH